MSIDGWFYFTFSFLVKTNFLMLSSKEQVKLNFTSCCRYFIFFPLCQMHFQTLYRLDAFKQAWVLSVQCFVPCPQGHGYFIVCTVSVESQSIKNPPNSLNGRPDHYLHMNRLKSKTLGHLQTN
jgi:hypothetical protein